MTEDLQKKLGTLSTEQSRLYATVRNKDQQLQSSQYSEQMLRRDNMNLRDKESKLERRLSLMLLLSFTVLVGWVLYMIISILWGTVMPWYQSASHEPTSADSWDDHKGVCAKELFYGG